MKHILTVETGEHDREQCPVSASIPREASSAAGSIRLVRRGDGKEIPCQCRETESDLVVEWIVEKAFRGERLVYEAEVSEKPPAREAHDGVLLRQTKDQIDVLISGTRFCSYYHGPATPKPYLGPIMGPFGTSLTRLDLRATEHPHHRSLWVGHGEVNGVDFWGEPREGRPGVHGRQVLKSIDALVHGPVYGLLSVTNTWEALSGEDVLREATTFKVYATAEHLRILDARIDLKPIRRDVLFGGTKEAGPFAIRVAEGMKVDNGGSFVNGCGGVEEKECWAKRAPWCDYYGVEGGHMYGIAVFDNPANDSYPTTWHIRNYGLMSPNCFLMGPRTVKAGETLSFQYRVIFHTGDVRQAGIGDRFDDYINPPVASAE